jgi:hypothetical protein
MTEAAKSTEVSPAPAIQGPKDVTALPEGSNLAACVAKINELVARANNKRDRGPESLRDMTEEDARNLLLGVWKDMSHKKAAEASGLSYGQVYSSRKGFTFKAIYKEWEKQEAAAKTAAKLSK